MKFKLREIVFLFLIIFVLLSCDILRFSLFEVTSWSPGEGFHYKPEEIVISMSFSRDPDRDSVERRFSLDSEDGRINGNFLWEGKKVAFIPLAPLEKNMDYTLSLTADAHDKKGLSMDFPFEQIFTTRPEANRPVLISHYPPLYGEIDDLRTEVRLEFSLPITLNTLYDNVSFNPSMTGSWRLEENERLAVFTPFEPWTINRRYEIRFSTSLTDNNRMNTRNDFTSVFITGTDREEPFLLHASRITKTGEIILLQQAGQSPANFIENPGWEKDDRLLFVFSKPVDSLSVRNYLSVDDASSPVMETSPGYESEIIFRFEAALVFESRFAIRLKPGVKDRAGNESKDEYVFRVFANGEASMPPALVGIRMPMAPGSGTDLELVSFGIDSLFQFIPISDGADNYPATENIRTWIELYFAAAQGASIDLFSVMEFFRIETSNNVLNFSPRQIKSDSFSVMEPQDGWENFQRLEIGGYLTNSTNYGIVSFQIAPGLKDSFGNKNENLLRISLIK